MKRKQIYIAAGQERELQRLAEERGESEALIIRMALARYFARARDARESEREPALASPARTGLAEAVGRSLNEEQAPYDPPGERTAVERESRGGAAVLIRKQIHLDEAQDEAIRLLAGERGITQSVVFREALSMYIADSPWKMPRRTEDGPLWDIVGLRSDVDAPTDGSVNDDERPYGTPNGKHIRMEDTPLWAIVGLVGDIDAPTDSAINHDHYIYGVPKKYE